MPYLIVAVALLGIITGVAMLVPRIARTEDLWPGRDVR